MLEIGMQQNNALQFLGVVSMLFEKFWRVVFLLVCVRNLGAWFASYASCACLCLSTCESCMVAKHDN